MFPLGTPLVPHQVLTLQVFEPRYLALVQRCLAGDRRFGVVLIERGSEVGGGDVRFEVGTVARIVEVAELADERLQIAAVGDERLTVLRWLPDDPFPRADVEVVPDPESAADALARRPALVAAFDRVVAAARALGAVIPADLVLADDPIRVAWEATAMAPVGPIDVLAVLREDDPARRLDRVVEALGDAADLMELQRP